MNDYTQIGIIDYMIYNGDNGYNSSWANVFSLDINETNNIATVYFRNLNKEKAKLIINFKVLYISN